MNSKITYIESIVKKVLSEFDQKGTTFRLKSSDKIQFNPPLVGPSGAKLIAYEWKYKWDEYFNKIKGEFLPRRFSDWDSANVSADTGRNIVHSFDIETSDGVKSVSSESANILLGFAKRGDRKSFPSLANSLKTLANLKMQLAGIEQAAQSWEEVRNRVKNLDFDIKSVDDSGGWVKSIFIDIDGSVYEYKNRDRDIKSLSDVNKYLHDPQIQLYKQIQRRYISDFMIAHDFPERQPSIGDLPDKIKRQERKIQDMINLQNRGQ